MNDVSPDAPGPRSDHESIWGQRFVTVAGPEGRVHLSETGTEGDTRPAVLLSASACPLDRAAALLLSAHLLHYAQHGRLPPA